VISTRAGQCAGCNKCISSCPAPDANSSVSAGASSFVTVDPLRCIACGACLRACDHGARHFEDDTETFFEDLGRGMPISVVVAPSVRANFARPELLLGFLKSQGVQLAFDVSFGADITTWAYLKVIRERSLESVIAQPCPAIVNYVERYLPGLIGQLAPVHSPMMAAAIYLRSYLGRPERIAFLSPCVAKSDEIRAPETGGLVSYNVTFTGLLQHLERTGARLDQAQPAGYDDMGCGLGLLYSRPGGLRECVQHIAPRAWVRQIEGPERAYPYLHAYEERLRQGKPLPLLVDILSCTDGCNLGPGTDGKAELDDIDVAFNALKASHAARRAGLRRKPQSLLRYFEKHLRLEDFLREYCSRASELARSDPDPDAIERAFESMRKLTPDSRAINCTACGYHSCRRMAVAIARGLNHPGNCIYFTREEMKSEKEQIEHAHATLRESKDRIAQSVAEMTQSLQTLAGSNQSALRDAERVQANVGEVRTAALRLREAVTAINRWLGKFDLAVEDILGVAASTHVVSVNASLEAARAQEAGKAFMPIVDQVRRLAEVAKLVAQAISSDRKTVGMRIEEIGGISSLLESSTALVDSAMRDVSAAESRIATQSSEILEAARLLAESSAEKGPKPGQ
jgi:Na+-translocating ferredoxin:NAD+ oxidoreductase RNF subunit RnfB